MQKTVCKKIKNSGETCKASVMKGTEFCYFHSKQAKQAVNAHVDYKKESFAKDFSSMPGEADFSTKFGGRL